MDDSSPAKTGTSAQLPVKKSWGLAFQLALAANIGGILQSVIIAYNLPYGFLGSSIESTSRERMYAAAQAYLYTLGAALAVLAAFGLTYLGYRWSRSKKVVIEPSDNSTPTAQL